MILLSKLLTLIASPGPLAPAARFMSPDQAASIEKRQRPIGKIGVGKNMFPWSLEHHLGRRRIDIGQNRRMTALGFEPTLLRTGACGRSLKYQMRDCRAGNAIIIQ